MHYVIYHSVLCQTYVPRYRYIIITIYDTYISYLYEYNMYYCGVEGGGGGKLYICKDQWEAPLHCQSFLYKFQDLQIFNSRHSPPVYQAKFRVKPLNLSHCGSSIDIFSNLFPILEAFFLNPWGEGDINSCKNPFRPPF